VAVGVSGGIAAYKTCELVRWLKQRGATVIVVMTAAAREFVTPLTFQTLSGNPVVHDLWGDQRPRFELPERARRKVAGKVEHVDVAEAIECLVIAPATANLMARLVHGEAPDALTAVALACRAPIIVCPAMDLQMWQQPATQENVRALKRRGAVIVGPESGELASGLAGPGRLAATDAIGEAIEAMLVRRESLEGVRVLIGAGRTEEPIDPVRVLTNRSSGRMGFALAEAARDRGADVTVVAGPTSVETPHGVSLVPVTTAAEMQRALAGAAAGAQVVLMAAAVADYRPVKPSREKLKRSGGRRTLELTPNPDILAGLAAARRPGQVLVGFALETQDGVKNARAKLRGKGVDLIVLNSPKAGIGGDTNRVTLVDESSAESLPTLGKREVAERILDRVIALRRGRGAGKGVARRARAVTRAPRPRSRATSRARATRSRR
jgi:phosphopantothenoylcysteine decarboxylase/phosphopantothenate--cysteine ligase